MCVFVHVTCGGHRVQRCQCEGNSGGQHHTATGPSSRHTPASPPHPALPPGVSHRLQAVHVWLEGTTTPHPSASPARGNPSSQRHPKGAPLPQRQQSGGDPKLTPHYHPPRSPTHHTTLPHQQQSDTTPPDCCFRPIAVAHRQDGPQPAPVCGPVCPVAVTLGNGYSHVGETQIGSKHPQVATSSLWHTGTSPTDEGTPHAAIRVDKEGICKCSNSVNQNTGYTGSCNYHVTSPNSHTNSKGNRVLQDNNNPWPLLAIFGAKKGMEHGAGAAALPPSGRKEPKGPPTGKRDLPTISTEEWHREGPDPERHSSHSSLVKLEDGSKVPPGVRKRHKKAISRSRSDLTKRYSNSSDLSELSARFSRNSADLEKFFNEMGLDRTVLDPMISSQFGHAQSSSSLNVFESVSSVGSPWETRSWCSEDSQQKVLREPPPPRGLRTLEIEEQRPVGPMSVVERNARVIKWLCSMRKTNPAGTPPSTTQQDSEDG